MPPATEKPEKSPDAKSGDARTPWSHWLIAAAVSLTVIIAGMLVVNLLARDFETRRQVDMLVHGSSIRASLSRELNKVLYLSSGMSAYLAVRRDDLHRNEIESILASLYREAIHVRNFAIAVGYRLTYIYPVQGNQKALGLYYPDSPEQWPAVERAIKGGKPTLAGPLELVQGGSGLIYRVPIFINDKYWGLLSSVIDSQSLLKSALEENIASNLILAIRGKDGKGMAGDVFWGDAAVFDNPDAQLIDIEVPGGKWVMAIQSRNVPSPAALWLIQGFVLLLALILGWSAMVLLSQRSRLTRQAMFDPLTGLPNRLLADDRISLALSTLQRNETGTCLLLFLDLDGFKAINDRYGHKAGDAALQSAAARVKASVRRIDTVSRWGGDEFIVFMENIQRSEIGEIIGKIRRLIEKPTRFDSHDLTLGVSIGSAYAPDDGRTLDELVHVADERMYADKATRKQTG